LHGNVSLPACWHPGNAIQCRPLGLTHKIPRFANTFSKDKISNNGRYFEAFEFSGEFLLD
jgi:hypothetical protein